MLSVYQRSAAGLHPGGWKREAGGVSLAESAAQFQFGQNNFSVLNFSTSVLSRSKLKCFQLALTFQNQSTSFQVWRKQKATATSCLKRQRRRSMQEVITSPAAAKKTSVDAAVAAAFSPKKEQRTTPTALHGSKDVGKCLVKHCGTSSDWSALNGIEDTPSHFHFLLWNSHFTFSIYGVYIRWTCEINPVEKFHLVCLFRKNTKRSRSFRCWEPSS